MTLLSRDAVVSLIYPSAAKKRAAATLLNQGIDIYDSLNKKKTKCVLFNTVFFLISISRGLIAELFECVR